MKLVKTALATTTFALLAGCMVGPDFEKPAAPTSTHYDVKAEQALAGDAAQHIDFDKKIDGDWWSSLGSSKLDQVMHN